MTQHANDELTRIVLSPLVARALLTIADLGIADHIEPGAPRSVAYLAKATGCHEPSLYRALRLLASHGVFSEAADGEFDHTVISEALASGAAGSYRAGAQLYHYLFAVMDQLDHSIRTGESGFTRVFRKPLFEHLKEHPELAPIFDAGMTAFHGYEADAMLDAYDFAATRVLADIGGGNGSLLASVLKRHPTLRGILFDLGHVSTRARVSLAAQGLAERCQVIEGDFFESIPSVADTYLLRHVLHDWRDEECAQILRNCRDAMDVRGRLLVVECVVPVGNTRSISKEYDVAMMLGPGGLERTEAQFRALLKASGFEVTSVTPTSSMVSVVEARPTP